MKEKIIQTFSAMNRTDLLKAYKERVDKLAKAVVIENFDDLIEEIEVISDLLITDSNE